MKKLICKLFGHLWKKENHRRICFRCKQHQKLLATMYRPHYYWEKS